MIPSNVSTLYDETAASITSTWKEVVSQIVLGSTSVEDGLKSYKNFWDSVDGDTMLKELNGQQAIKTCGRKTWFFRPVCF